MGRSFHFQYSKVPSKIGPLNQIIESLKVGDTFRFEIEEYLIYDEILKIYVKPIIRAPSIYGFIPLPLDNKTEYLVQEINEEPELEKVKGLRSLRFTAKDCDQYFLTHRLITDGTLRECEGLGIDFIVTQIKKI